MQIQGRLWAASVAALLLVLAMSGVGSTPAAHGAAKRFTIGSMIWNTTIPFYTNLIKGEQDAGKKYGMTVIIRNGEADLAKRSPLSSSLLRRKWI